MQSEKILTDAELGKIVLRRNPRARKYIIRIKPDVVSVTVPWGGSYATAESFFKKNRTYVLNAREKINARKKAQIQNDNLMNNNELSSIAKVSLPPRLADLARAHGFTFVSVKTRKSKTRWGSCSSKKAINLSYYLLLLPPHLIDYVMLHELCHTVHMNHSPAFWALLDQHSGGNAKAFRKELKNYHIPSE
ncbi:zinc protease [Bacteroidia bacterium]|nr:zinc protease [Bacteroidia bacterium]